MVRNARIKIPINGQLRPYTDGDWVIFSPSAFPVGFMRMEYKHLHQQREDYGVQHEADERTAFADYWSSMDHDPLTKAMEGYTIKLVPKEEVGELLRQHLGKDAEGEKERQHDDEEQAG
ncbi:hypothetical protein [Streptomyces sp. NPDC001843]|uniref:hypothetical protein n=1 Tax=Streptomyces sp. NPDC001843 TaxID=3364617 RepID=UPI003687BAA5